MKKCKLIASALVLAALTVGSGKIASAYVQDSLPYGYTLKAFGTTSSSGAVTKTNTNDAYNDVTSNSKPDYEYVFWATDGAGGNQITNDSHCYGTGLKRAYYYNDADRQEYYGNLIGMKIKTGFTTLTSMYISGTFTP